MPIEGVGKIIGYTARYEATAIDAKLKLKVGTKGELADYSFGATGKDVLPQNTSAGPNLVEHRGLAIFGKNVAVGMQLGNNAASTGFLYDVTLHVVPIKTFLSGANDEFISEAKQLFG